jgi:hypothetical protein
MREGIFTPGPVPPEGDPEEFVGTEPIVPATAAVTSNPMREIVERRAERVGDTLVAAQHILDRAQADYVAQGAVVRDLEIRHQRAAGDLRKAEHELITGSPQPTPLEVSRSYIASEQAKRAAEANGAAPRAAPSIMPGPSALDRSRARFAYQSGDGGDFARKQIRVGQSRGSLPSQFQGTRVGPDYAGPRIPPKTET